MRKKEEKRGHATVSEDDGVNYREIAEIMSEMGFTMNHSSARNYVLRVMRKFAVLMLRQHDMPTDDVNVDRVARSPAFQDAVANMLHIVESRTNRR